jgi:competence protein ComEA
MHKSLHRRLVLKKYILDILMITILSSALMFAAGCSKDEAVILPERETVLSGEQFSNTNDTDKAGNPNASDEENVVSGHSGTSTDPVIAKEPAKVTVYVCGAVRWPGVYTLDEGKRIADALELAGGLNDEADRDYINQALLLTDCQKIYIPRQEEVVNSVYEDSEHSEGRSHPDESGNEMSPLRVNINTGSEQELMTLPGIGEAKARLIIEYRDSNGGFSTIEDIMKISGIKEGMFNKIKDRICI